MRFSLSPEPEEWQRGIYRIRDESDSSSDEGSFVAVSKEDCEYSDSDEEDEDDYVHPVGFPAKSHPAWGRTRFSLDPFLTSDSIEEEWENIHKNNENKSPLDDFRPFMQSFPPIESYIDRTTATAAALLELSTDDNRKKVLEEFDDNEMHQITQLLQAASLVDPVKALPPSTSNRTVADRSLALLADTANHIRRQIEQEEQRMDREHREAAQALQMLLESNQKAADKIRKEETKLEQEMADRLEEQVQAEKKAQKVADDAQKEADIRAQKKAEIIERQKRAIESEKAAKTEYLVKAKKLIAQLAQLRQSIEPFEKSKSVSKRRLGMKKVVRGKVNTLAENAEKIRSVASEVGNAITEARQVDADLKKQQEAGNSEITSEMMKGKRYLVDLLSSSIMERVQAESFSG